MPAVKFEVLWPDEETCLYYCPSTVIHQYLQEKKVYPLEDFLSRSDQGLLSASERVKEKFGYYCSAASDTLTRIHNKASLLKAKDIAGHVQVIKFL